MTNSSINRALLVVVAYAAVLTGCSDSEPAQTASKPGARPANKVNEMPAECVAGSSKTGREFIPRQGDIPIFQGPGEDTGRIVNKKASEMLGRTHYVQIDESTTIYEECVNGQWSYIRLISPDYLRHSHKGWILSKFVNEALQEDPEAGYDSKISSYALSPYTKKSYPKTVKKFGSRLSEIEAYRRRAAEVALDSGKCDFVDIVELSSDRSSLSNLNFFVDCRNEQRIYLSESQLDSGSPVLTQEERAWTKAQAMTACEAGIKERALIPSELDIHNIMGTNFYRAPRTHNVLLSMDFDAKNAFGVEMKYTAKCSFRPGELGEIEILIRE